MSRLDGEQEIAEAAKNFNMLESTLIKNRTVTLFGEINQEVARRTAEKLLALAFESEDPITMYIGISRTMVASWARPKPAKSR